jgi:hypothetical protein
MKLALAGFFMMLGLFNWIAADTTGDHFFLLAALAFGFASCACSVSVLRGYKGEKRQ